MLETKKETVLRYAKLSYQQQLFAGTSGNLSIYDRDSDTVIITPSGLPYETMDVDDIVLIRLDGSVMGGDRRPSSEWQLHTAIYRNLPGCNAVVHSHSPYATSFAATHENIPFFLVEMMYFLGGDIPVAEFAVNGSSELGEKVVTALGNRFACLLANHGVVAVGDTLERAQINAVYTEDVAKIYSIARTHGNVKTIAPEVERFMRKKYGLPENPR